MPYVEELLTSISAERRCRCCVADIERDLRQLRGGGYTITDFRPQAQNRRSQTQPESIHEDHDGGLGGGHSADDQAEAGLAPASTSSPHSVPPPEGGAAAAPADSSVQPGLPADSEPASPPRQAPDQSQPAAVLSDDDSVGMLSPAESEAGDEADQLQDAPEFEPLLPRLDPDNPAAEPPSYDLPPDGNWLENQQTADDDPVYSGGMWQYLVSAAPMSEESQGSVDCGGSEPSMLSMPGM